jgi:hypothetical protein
MAKVEVTNLSDNDQEIVLATKPVNGVPATYRMRPAETTELDVNLKSTWIQAMVRAGVISIAKGEAALPPVLSQPAHKPPKPATLSSQATAEDDVQ